MNKIRCNQCGRMIKVENDIAREDYLHVRKQWGYFSEKDGRTQEFNICETCFSLMERDFAIAPLEYETEEIM